MRVPMEDSLGIVLYLRDKLSCVSLDSRPICRACQSETLHRSSYSAGVEGSVSVPQTLNAKP